MAVLNTTDRQRLAVYLLENPGETVGGAGRKLGLGSSAGTFVASELTPGEFLKVWGGEFATPERIRACLEGGLGLVHKRVDERRAAQECSRISIAERRVRKRISSANDYLLASQCQWLVEKDGSKAFCKEEVAVLYCAKHDALALEQQAGRSLPEAP